MNLYVKKIRVLTHVGFHYFVLLEGPVEISGNEKK